MLYDGAIKFLNGAKDRIDAKDVAGKGKLISSAIDVINELASSLNAEKGGDLAANLSQLYFYCNKRLFMANSRMDKTAIDEVIKILGGLRSAYAQILDTPEAQAAMAQQSAAPAHNAMRSPIGVVSAPSGAPVPTAKVHNAYATQGAAPADTGRREDAALPLPPDMAETMDGAAPEAAHATPIPLEAEYASETVPEDTPLLPPLMPEAPPTVFDQGKRLTASNLYRKFAP